MEKSVAKALVGNYWRTGVKDSRFVQAAAVLGLSARELERLAREVRKVEGGLGPCIPTPTGGQTR